MNTELLVLGGGAAGLAAARTARRLGRDVVLVQDGPVGGDCTFTGCVPSKTLIAAAAQGLDPSAALQRVRDTVARVAATETADVLRAEGITVVEGRARFSGPCRVRVDGRSVFARRVVIATGSEPVVPSAFGPAALTTDSVWDLDALPDRLSIVGAGPAGCELAQALARLGVRVTLVERAGRILPGVDADAAAVIDRALRADGVDVRTGADDVPPGPGPVLVAVGRRPRTAALGLADAGVDLGPDDAVRVDDRCRTTADGVFAAGDVTGRFVSTPAADESGRTAALNALKRGSRMRMHEGTTSRVVFTDPEVAHVGVGPDEAPVGSRIARLALSEVDRARTDGREDGFVTLVAAPRPVLRHLGGGRLIGAVVVAPPAGELIGELALAVRTGMFAGRLAQTVHPYPAYATAIRSCAARLLFGPRDTVDRTVER